MTAAARRARASGTRPGAPVPLRGGRRSSGAGELPHHLADDVDLVRTARIGRVVGVGAHPRHDCGFVRAQRDGDCRNAGNARRWTWTVGEIRLPDTKTGAKVVPLGAAARELLASLPSWEGNPYVIVGDRPNSHFIGIQKVWERIRRQAGLDDVRIHDLRHSFASVGASSGDSLLVIGALLGHRDHGTTQRYAHLSDDPLQAAADRISAHIATALERGQLLETDKSTGT